MAKRTALNLFISITLLLKLHDKYPLEIKEFNENKNSVTAKYNATNSAHDVNDTSSLSHGALDESVQK